MVRDLLTLPVSTRGFDGWPEAACFAVYAKLEESVSCAAYHFRWRIFARNLRAESRFHRRNLQFRLSHIEISGKYRANNEQTARQTARQTTSIGNYSNVVRYFPCNSFHDRVFLISRLHRPRYEKREDQSTIEERAVRLMAVEWTRQ